MKIGIKVCFVLTIMVFSVFFAANQCLAESLWSHYGADAHFTACNSEETQITPATINQLVKTWGIGCDDGWFSVYSRSPAIWNNRLYCTGAGNALQCLNASDGTLLWTYGETDTGWAPQPTVTSDGKVLYLQGVTTSYILHAVDGMTGSKLWESPLQFDLGWSDSNVICVDESRSQVLMLEAPFAPDSGKLYAIDLTSGTINWYMSKALNNFSFNGDYLILDGDRVYARIIQESWMRERVGVIDLTTQQLVEVWSHPQEEYDMYINSMTLCDDALAVTFRKGNSVPGGDLIIYDTADGTVDWSYSDANNITGDVAYNPVLDRLYLPTEPRLYAIDLNQTPSDIQFDWTYLGYDEIFSTSVAGGIVYFLSDTNAYAVDETTGTMLRSFPLGEQAYEGTRVAICDGVIYFSGNGGTCDLFAYGFPPACTELGVTLYMPAHDFTWDDPCSCSVDVCNPGSSALSDVPLVVLLDVFGALYFAPGFSNALDYYTIQALPGWTTVDVLPEFPWPFGVGVVQGVVWYAAMLNPEMTALRGSMDSWTFGWH